MKKSQVSKWLDFSDRVVVITGAAGQLGTELCETFVELGAKVVGLDIVLGEQVRGVTYKKTDVTQEKSVIRAIEGIFKEHQQIDVLINNAGVGVFNRFDSRTERELDFVLNVNVKSTIWCIKTLSALKKKYDQSKKASVVNISSLYGLVSSDPRIYTDLARMNSEIYSATKAGAIQLSKYFAVHLAGENIRVNSISPGGIFNDANPQGADFVKNYSYRTPMGRMAKTQEMVGPILYLASDASSYTTGANLVVDGGFSCW
ncbi:MAG: short-chain dehydrogenase [Candidatus Pacebacteria bacterium CG10_big_fil_rev_8_21_14_0_10_56_10]|nr:MAG: short-chain dehydrogenase [Candidatus Pacebacteria bacterium CG10_big_fil_rev_8_21_14_0_10_56_10]